MTLTNKEIIFDSEIKSYDPDKHTIISYISTSTPDYVDDVVNPKGLKFMRLPNGQPKKPAVLFGHDSSKPVVGKCEWVKVEDDYGVLAKTKFADTERGRELEYLYANGFMTDFSVRLEFELDDIEENEKGGWNIKSWYMPEYSCVPLGCNFEAMTKKKSLNDIKEASNHISHISLKKDFDNYIKQKEMEDKLQEVNDKINDLTSRIEALERVELDEETSESVEDKPAEEEKKLTIEDFQEVAKSIFN